MSDTNPHIEAEIAHIRAARNVPPSRRAYAWAKSLAPLMLDTVTEEEMAALIQRVIDDETTRALLHVERALLTGENV